MENGDILLNQITATAPYTGYGVEHARLDSPYAWVPKVPANSWLQIDLLRQTIVTGMIMQGQADGKQWVTEYKVLTSLDKFLWENVTHMDGKVQVKDSMKYT